MAEVRCKICGAAFEPTRADATSCSDRCRQQAQRDRAKSAVLVSVGGVESPVATLKIINETCNSSATIELAGPLRAEPSRDQSGRVPVEVRSGDTSTICAGDLEHVARNLDGGATVLQAAGLSARLQAQTWGPATWCGLTIEQFAAAAARRAGLEYAAPVEPLDLRPLAVFAAADGLPDSTHNAFDLLRWAARELGRSWSVRDGVLQFDTPPPVRVLDCRNVSVQTHGGPADRIAVVVRARPLGAMAAPPLRSTSLFNIEPDRLAYLVQADGRRQVDIDALAERLALELSAELLHVAADIKQHDAHAGDRVRIAGRMVRITRIEHTYSIDSGLHTHIVAVAAPPAPSIARETPRAAPIQVISPWAAAA